LHLLPLLLAAGLILLLTFAYWLALAQPSPLLLASGNSANFAIVKIRTQVHFISFLFFFEF
jgi:hypothetical protein